MRETRIFTQLQKLKPSELVVENESHMHGFSRGEDSHFKILIVSEEFHGLSRVERHQRVNDLLEEEFVLGLHAVTLRALTDEEWQKSDPRTFNSPGCASRKRV